MRDVIAYADYRSLKASDLYGHLRGCPQIAESSRLAAHMKETGMFSNVTTFTNLISAVDPDWAGRTSQVEDLILMGRTIRGRMEATTDESERLWLRGCSRRSFEMYSAICMLEEASVSPDDVVPTDRDQELMLDVWRGLYEGDSIRRFRDRMSNRDALPILLRELGGGDVEPLDMTVVVHAFYFITPIQERILRILEAAGVSLVFLIPYNRVHAYAHEVWDMMYRPENGFEGQGSWTFIDGTVRNSFGSLLEGEEDLWNSFEVREYGGVMDMVRDLTSENPDSITLYSPDDVTANAILQDFFPDMYGLRTILSYPVGGFIRALHQMWDVESGTVRISPEAMEECFAYGWVSDGSGRPSNMLIGDLRKVMPFFEGCSTMEQWDRRLELLHSIQVDVVGVYRSDSEDPSERRWEDVMGNPFSNFSMFDVEAAELDSITEVMARLMNYAQGLFGNGSVVDVGSHVRRLLDIIDNGRDPSGIRDEEYKVITGVLGRIGESSHGNHEVSDIVTAINVFLESRVKLDFDGKTRLPEWVRPMYEMDGNGSDRVLLLMCDATSLPGSRKANVWPLSDGLMKSTIRSQTRSDEHPLLGFAVFSSECAPLANRYLVYSAFKNKHVTLSYVREIDGKMLVPSPYLRLLGSICREESWSDPPGPTRVPVGAIPAEVPRVIGTTPNDSDVVPEAVMDRTICPRRFLYGYVLNRRPSYSSQFHQEFLLGGLMEAVANLGASTEQGREEAVSNVKELFPNIKRVNMQNVVDNSHRQRTGTGDRRGNRRYTAMRHWVQFPRPLFKTIEEAERNPEHGKDTDTVRGAPDRISCMYCPHSGFCRYAIFPVDEE